MMIYKGNSYKFYDIVSIIEEQSSSSVNFPL